MVIAKYFLFCLLIIIHIVIWVLLISATILTSGKLTFTHTPTNVSLTLSLAVWVWKLPLTHTVSFGKGSAFSKGSGSAFSENPGPLYKGCREKLFQQILTKKKVTCKTQSFYILLAFLLITLALLIVPSIYCYLIKQRAKKLLPFHVTRNSNNSVLIV